MDSDHSEEDVKAVPGQYGCRLLNEFDIMMNGHSYFYKKMRKNNSTVVRANVVNHRTILCDREAIGTLFDSTKVLKEPSFVKMKLNPNVLNGYIPSLFSNDQPHEMLKTFEIELLKLCQGTVTVECVNQIMLEYFKKWQKSPPGKNFEDELQTLEHVVYCSAILGGRMDYGKLEIWKKGLFSKIGSDDEKRSISMLRSILDEVKSLPNMKTITNISQQIGLPLEQALFVCLFIVGFNISGSAKTLVSCVAELFLLSDGMKSCLRGEVMSKLEDSELTYEALNNMALLESFVQEVCRLHPPVSMIFAKTREDFVLQSRSGRYAMNAGDSLIGEIYICQRDPNVFVDPDQFKADRFFGEEQLLNNLLVFGGPYNKEATCTDHKCPGQNNAMTFLKAVLVYFMSSCEFTLAGNLSWKDNNLRRFSCPDSPLRLKTFKFDASSILLKHQQDIKLEEYIP